MKKPKTQHEPLGPVHVKSYRYNPSNVFTNMQNGQIGVHFLFDRTHTFAILDRRPASHGHALLVVKHPVPTLLSDLSPDVMAQIMVDLQVLSRAVQEATACDGFVVQQNNGPAAGQTVPQLHFHIQPCYVGRKLLPPEDRKELAAEEAGPLIARIRNVLPEDYCSGLHIWASSSEHMEGLGVLLQQHLVQPGMVAQLNGQLGSGKTTIARGFVRSFCQNAVLDVPSPTFLLCLSYQEDLGHDAAARSTSQRQPQVHHMDPYRLGTNVDKMAGLIDFEDAFQHDVCLIEWPDRMPKGVLELKRRGIEVVISGQGVQGVGRLVTITPLTPDDPCAEVLQNWRRNGVPAIKDMAGPKSSDGVGKQLLFPAADSLSANEADWLVMGIESSCDDTAAAIVRGDGQILAHKIASQVGLHEQYGGVKPDVARQAHADAICSVVEGCLADAGVQPQQLTAIAATVGPGLALCLQVGVRQALSLASEHQIPFLPIHHMEAHTLITRMPGVMSHPMTFPALLLLVSGGHNMLVLCEGVGRYRVIGTTLDDSVGECFDKVARLLGITSIPGGPKLEKLAESGDAAKYKLTMPMQTGLYKDSCNFSFSGLKTSVSKLVEDERQRLQRGDENGTVADNRSKGGKKGSKQQVPLVGVAAAASNVNGTLPADASAGIATGASGGAVKDASAGNDAGSAAGPNGTSTVEGNGVVVSGEREGEGGVGRGSEGIVGNGVPDAMQIDSVGGGAGIGSAASGQGAAAEAAVGSTQETSTAIPPGTGSVSSSLQDKLTLQSAPPASTATAATAATGATATSAAVASAEEQSVDAVFESAFESVKADIAASFQSVCVKFLKQRTARALQWLKQDCAQHGGSMVTCLVVAGGVAANKSVRAGMEEVAKEYGIPCVCPPIKYCTDNGLMVAWTGIERLRLGLYKKPPSSGSDIDQHVEVVPRWPIGPLDPRSSVKRGATSKMYH